MLRLMPRLAALPSPSLVASGGFTAFRGSNRLGRLAPPPSRPLSGRPPPPPPRRRPPPPRRPSSGGGDGGGGSGGGSGGKSIVSQGRDAGTAVQPKLSLVSGEHSRAWNLVWLFGGLAFAWSVVSQIPERVKFLQGEQGGLGGVPRLPAVSEISRHDVGRAGSAAIRHCFHLLCLGSVTKVDRAELKAAIGRLPALQVR